MTTVTLTRGIPASGKTTWARQHCADNPQSVNLNRDDLRHMLFGPDYRFSRAGERAVTAAQHAAAAALLDLGRDVIVSDTNLRPATVDGWRDLADTHGADFALRDFDIDLDDALARNDLRADGVPAKVIHDMHRRYVEQVHPERIVHPDPDLLPAILVDVDGTIADHQGIRSPYDWQKVGDDRPIPVVIDLVRRLAEEHTVIVMTGRDGAARDATIGWLNTHGVPFDFLHIRAAGDTRKDSVIKLELFDAHVRGKYDVRLVIDDRLQVIHMWRSLGLRVADVAGGLF